MCQGLYKLLHFFKEMFELGEEAKDFPNIKGNRSQLRKLTFAVLHAYQSGLGQSLLLEKYVIGSATGLLCAELVPTWAIGQHMKNWNLGFIELKESVEKY